MELRLDPNELRAVIAEVCREVLLLVGHFKEETDGRIGIPERDAAAMLCLKEHVLRDERGRGRIKASKIVGGRIRYQRSDLIDYLVGRRIGVDQDLPSDGEEPKRRRYTRHSTGGE